MIVSLLLVTLIGQNGASPQAPPDARDVSVAGLPARVAADFKRLATRTPLLVLASGGGAAAAAHSADAAIVRHVGTSEVNSRVFDVGAEAGDGVVQWSAAAVIYGVGLVSRSPGTQALGSALLEAQIVEGVITQGLKHTVSRTRPNGGRYSFPSGHESASFATADVLMQRFGWKAGLPAYGAAVFIGWSRVAQREHYLSDVIFGAAVGVASARTLELHLRRRGIAVAAAPRRRGAAILVAVNAR
ncbi:MAG TPA: phosphatase PAP2 family protein [Vicinamibacterales bacterium]|nr:phosphatase PAP2 family protein [Vicinamibacterales bacterium]